ncbi:DUF3151 domain-containing protein [Isoptericola sp. NEAU-Y5]|uniref:DUF3151 domain-containing protein n=1 Tax=Isoptericola luteus TaxID=2879484 RepID=A0ABS7ZDY9_9MICO|nr:DUF3151 domain-containing protein [Isoptericola sp. NEAU-Y5]MCA5892039.1 DUF3151 domain-containing protein [Isoptericola sp. NEAU-Y5]
MTSHPQRDLLAGPPPTLLPDDHPQVREGLETGEDPARLAADHPASCLAWAVLAEQTLGDPAADDAAADTQGPGTVRAVTAYAYARTGYHRGLDALRRAGWRGQGPVPADHEPNQGFLRALLALSRAAHLIGEEEESERCAQFLRDSGTSPEEVRALVAG